MTRVEPSGPGGGGAPGDDETLLVRRYRSLLGILPPSYRAEREDEMVAAFADATEGTEDDDLAKPGREETAAVVALAARTWPGGAGASARLFTCGQAVRLFGLLGVYAQAVVAAAGAAGLLGVSLFGSAVTRAQLRTAIGGAGPAGAAGNIAWSVLELAWIPAYVSILYGHRRAARLWTLLAIVPVLVRATGAASVSWTASAAVLLPVLLPAAAMTIGFHRDAPPVAARGWLAALPAGVAALLGCAFLAPAVLPYDFGVYCWLAIAAAAVHLVRGLRAGAPAGPRRSPGLALFALFALALRGLTVDDYRGMVPDAGPVVYGQAALVVVLAVLLSVAAFHRSRGRP